MVSELSKRKYTEAPSISQSAYVRKCGSSYKVNWRKKINPYMHIIGGNLMWVLYTWTSIVLAKVGMGRRIAHKILECRTRVQVLNSMYKIWRAMTLLKVGLELKVFINQDPSRSILNIGKEVENIWFLFRYIKSKLSSSSNFQWQEKKSHL